MNSFEFYPQITLLMRLAERSGSLFDNFFCKPSTNYIFTCDQSSEALMKFKEEIERADLVDKVANSQSLDPNINYKTFEDILINAKQNNLPVKK